MSLRCPARALTEVATLEIAIRTWIYLEYYNKYDAFSSACYYPSGILFAFRKIIIEGVVLMKTKN